MGLVAKREGAVLATDFVLGAGWGGSTKVVAAGSTDEGGDLTITGVTGGGLAQATATIVFTFREGAFPTAPIYVVTSSVDSPLTETGGWAQTATTTALTLTYGVLPVNARIYHVRYARVA
jgi:hypothetical protein